MNILKILMCDLDGVLADFNKGFSQILSEILGEGPIIRNKEEVKSWSWNLWYPGATQGIVNMAWNKLRNTKSFWENLDPINIEDIKILNELRNRYDIYFVTSRIETNGFSALRQSQSWLAELGFTQPNVIVTPQKNALAALLQANIIIDDKPEYFERGMIDINLYWESLFMIDYPYNRSVPMELHPGTIRVDSLSQVLQML